MKSEKNEGRPSFYLKNILEKYDITPEQWKTSGELNRQLAVSLSCSKKFQWDVKKIRSEFQVPKHTNINDAVFWFEYELEGINEDGSPIDKHRKNLFLEKILWLMNSYKMPLNFFYWVLDWIFYDEEPDWKPLYNYVAFEELESQVATKLTLTTKEKRWLKKTLRHPEIAQLKTDGLPKNYHQIASAIDAAKNNRRKIRNFDKTIQIAIEMQKRTNKKSKNYAEGSYLALLKKRGHPDKELKQLEKNFKDSVEVTPRYTAKKVAQKVGIGKKRGKEAYLRKKYERFEKRLKPPEKPVN